MNYENNESIYDNRYRVAKDVKKMKELGIKSPELDWSKSLKIGKCCLLSEERKEKKNDFRKVWIIKQLKQKKCSEIL